MASSSPRGVPQLPAKLKFPDIFPGSQSPRMIEFHKAPVDARTRILPQKAKTWKKHPKFPADKECGVFKETFVGADGRVKIPKILEKAELARKDIVRDTWMRSCNLIRAASYWRYTSFLRHILNKDPKLAKADMSGDEQMEFPGPHDHSRAVLLYYKACSLFKLVPSGCFLRSLKGGRVSAGYQGIGEEGAMAITVSLMTCLFVTELRLPGNKLGGEGITILSELIQSNETIKVLDVNDNDLGRRGGIALALAIRENESLQQINAAGNRFDDKVGMAFGEAFKVNDTINQFDISRNEIGALGTKFLCNSLETNCALTHLDLSHNHIRLEGFLGVAEMLKENDTLKNLNVSWNGIGTPQAHVMGHGLNFNNGLSVLTCNGCRMNCEALTTLLENMKRNRALRSLQIKDNPITNADLTLFVKKLDELPSVGLHYIDASSVTVTMEFVNFCKDVAKRRPGFLVTYCSIFSDKDSSRNMMESMDMSGTDPLELIINFMRTRNLRLLEIFSMIDNDKSGTVSRKELIHGIADLGIPLTIKQMDKMLADLDVDGDGEIDYGELLVGYKKCTRKLHRQAMINRQRSSLMAISRLEMLPSRYQRIMEANKAASVAEKLASEQAAVDHYKDVTMSRSRSSSLSSTIVKFDSTSNEHLVAKKAHSVRFVKAVPSSTRTV